MLLNNTRHAQIDLMNNAIWIDVGEHESFDYDFVDHWVMSDSQNLPLSVETVTDEWMAWCAFDGI